MHATNIENNWNCPSTSMTRKVCDWFNSVSNGRTGPGGQVQFVGILTFIELFTAEIINSWEWLGLGVRFRLVSSANHNTTLESWCSCHCCSIVKVLTIWVRQHYRFSWVCKKYILEVIVITWPYAIRESDIIVKFTKFQMKFRLRLLGQKINSAAFT